MGPKRYFYILKMLLESPYSVCCPVLTDGTLGQYMYEMND